MLALLAACTGERNAPEERIRDVIVALAQGARARDAASMRAHVSNAYSDEAGRDARAIAGIVAFHFLQNRPVYVLTRVSEIEITAPDAAQADVLVALAGGPIPDLQALPRVRADLYRFGLQMREEDGAWRVTSATWRPAALDDFR